MPNMPRLLNPRQTPPPKHRGGTVPPYRRVGGRLGVHSIAVMRLTGRRRVVARSGELCPLPAPSCLQPGRAQQLSPGLHMPPQPLSQPALALTS